MQVKVDWSLCEANGACVIDAPEIFEVRDDDMLYVLDEHPDESLRSAVEASVRACPKRALWIEG